MMELEDEEQRQPNEQQQEMEQVTISAQILLVVWKSIDPEYKSHYRAEIWRQFEERIATAARMTATLQAFLSRLCGMFSIATPGADEPDRAFLVEALHGHYGAPDALLEVIRKHPALCAVQVRVWNDQQKEMKNAGLSNY